MRAKVLGIVVGVLLVGSIVLTGVLFYNHYSNISVQEEKSQELAERRKEIEDKAQGKKEKDKSAYQDAKTGQYIQGEEQGNFIGIDEDGEPIYNTKKKGRNYVIYDEWVDKTPKYDPSKEYKNNDDFIVGEYTLDDGTKVPIYDLSDYNKWLYDTYLPKCLYKDTVTKTYKDALVDEYGIIVPWVKGIDGDYNWDLFDKKGNLKKKYIDEKTGKLKKSLKNNLAESQLEEYKKERKLAKDKLESILGE